MRNKIIQVLGLIAMASLLLPAAETGTATSAADALPRPTAEQARWQDYEIGIFYHYDVNPFCKSGWDHRQYNNFPERGQFLILTHEAAVAILPAWRAS